MLISKNVNPKNNIYYLGALIIEELTNSKNKSLDFFLIYNEIKKKEDITIGLFILAIDWLFLLNIVSYNNSLLKLKCS